MVASFFQTILQKNPLLFYAGCFCALGLVVCLLLASLDSRTLLGINIWMKPAKFFVSIGILLWTMAFYLQYLPQQHMVKGYSLLAVVAMAIELAIITFQASRGEMSHFNNSTPANSLLFELMGMAILVFTLATAVMGLLFFKTPVPPGVKDGYWWGIRLGLSLIHI